MNIVLFLLLDSVRPYFITYGGSTIGPSGSMGSCV